MKETQILKVITNYLQLKENAGELYFVRVGSGAVRINNPIGRDRFMKTGKAGCPDVIICRNGLFIGLEVKTETGKQSETQRLAEKRINKAGGGYCIVRSLQDVINMGF